MPHWTNNASKLPTPCYLIDESELKRNIQIISTLKKETNCQVILALKGFATFQTFPHLWPILDGVTASSMYEARLGMEEWNGDIHIHSIGMSAIESQQFNEFATHISFNSLNQLALYKKETTNITPSIGLRINPKVSQAPNETYNPCANYSRLGIPIEQVPHHIFDEIEGLHFHALCEQNTPPLFDILNTIEATFGHSLNKLKWINWGGGHLLTDADYNLDALAKKINEWHEKYHNQIILEPGEAIGRHCGYYVTKVLDIIENEKQIAICDISATAHMPDVLEYPYRPHILNSGKENEFQHNYIIGGNTCLAGDIIGTYSFKEPLKINQPLVFTDMGHYTIVKTSNFNGVKQPSIGIIDESGNIKMIKYSSYFNFKERLS